MPKISEKTALTGFLAALIVLLLAACGGGGGGPAPSQTGAPTPVPTPTLLPTGPTQPPPETAYRLLIREFTPTEDIIWRINPLDPAAREEVVRIPHREGYGIKPSLSPDGKLLAYLSLPDYALSAQSSQAEAYVMDLEKKEPVFLVDGVDLTYAPLWSPDSRLLYLRRLEGPEFLAADISILRVKVPPVSDPTPTPTPVPPPDATPVVTPHPVSTVLQDSIAHVLSFAPIGFADDGKSMFFAQVSGGTGGGTLIGIYAPATSEAFAEFERTVAELQKAADDENKRLADEAAANGLPPPEITVTPAPTPSPDARFVVQISDQVATSYRLSPDAHKVSYLDQLFIDGEIYSKAHVADLIAATTAPLPDIGFAPGQHLSPVWHPDGRLTVGLLPDAGGAGIMALIAVDGSSFTYLPQPQSGFDEPRSWAPDGSWLAVAHSTGNSLVNRRVSLQLVAPTGQRVTVIEGADNASEDSVLGWVLPEPETADAE